MKRICGLQCAGTVALLLIVTGESPANLSRCNDVTLAAPALCDGAAAELIGRGCGPA